MQTVFEYMPFPLVEFILKYAPIPVLAFSKKTSMICIGVAKQLVVLKSSALSEGKGKGDIMTSLVKANASENPSTALTESEMLSQMQTLMQAGYETTGLSLSWCLFELAKQPAIQVKLRAEIQAVWRTVRGRGDHKLGSKDLEAMNYTLAVVKETLRFHPSAHYGYRIALQDDVLPLSRPITTISGKTVTEVPVRKGLGIYISIAGYNRNPDVFGADAHVFNPERWMNDSVRTDIAPVGVYNNLMTFGSGTRACLGWRFAILEMQVFLVELIKNFEFAVDEEIARRIRREACFVMVPTVSGEVDKGPQLPLWVTPVLVD